MHFQKHYTREEARELLPKVRQWLTDLSKLRARLNEDERLMSERVSEGADLGGKQVNGWVRCMADLEELHLEFSRREILVKDIERGLVDFPALLDGKEVFLCWEKGEKDIEFWHDLEAGYAGRQRFED